MFMSPLYHITSASWTITPSCTAFAMSLQTASEETSFNAEPGTLTSMCLEFDLKKIPKNPPSIPHNPHLVPLTAKRSTTGLIKKYFFKERIENKVQHLSMYSSPICLEILRKFSRAFGLLILILPVLYFSTAFLTIRIGCQKLGNQVFCISLFQKSTNKGIVGDFLSLGMYTSNRSNFSTSFLVQ